MKRFLALLLLSCLCIPGAGAQSTIFLVRHAEKASGGGDDPDLSEAGRARAESLAMVLKDSAVSAIFVTELKRTQQTAAPLAKTLHLDAVVVPAKDRAALIARLGTVTGNVLIVGHSNTIPGLLSSFGVPTPVTIQDTDYDDLFVVVLKPTPRLVRLHYL